MTGRFRKCSTVGLGRASTSVSAHRSATAYFIIVEYQITRDLELEPCQLDFSLTLVCLIVKADFHGRSAGKETRQGVGWMELAGGVHSPRSYVPCMKECCQSGGGQSWKVISIIVVDIR